MGLVQFVMVLILIGVLLYLVNTFIPMDAKIKQILNVVVVILVIFWIIGVLGLFDGMGSLRIGHLR